MTAFEYLSVLLSIFLGLAITQVLQGYRSLLLARRWVHFHWPTLIWSLLVLLSPARLGGRASGWKDGGNGGSKPS